MQPVLIRLIFAISVTSCAANSPVSDLASAIELTDCNSARQRFRSASLDGILASWSQADVVVESLDMPKASEELRRTKKLTVPVDCFYKGYLAATQLTVSLNTEFTGCIDEHTIDGELANGRKFVFFLRRLSNASLLLLEGGLVSAANFNSRMQPICNLNNQTRQKACRNNANAFRTGCTLQLETFLSKESPRMPYFQPETTEASKEPISSQVSIVTSYRAPGSRTGRTSRDCPSRALMCVMSALVAVLIYCVC